jgi:phospholipid/cholesterol/gamma-HCH transport system substrate-binding protein
LITPSTPAGAAEPTAAPSDDSLEGLQIPRPRRNPGHTWLALAIVAAVLLTLTSAWRQGWFTPTSHVYIELDGAGGVQIGTPVRLKGFKIGEVDEINLSRSLVVRVRMRIESARMELLAANASAKFGRDSPIAGKFIEILPGEVAGPRLAAEQTLPVATGSDLDEVMATVKTAVEKLTVALSKIDPILDDTRKLTGEAVAMRESVHSSLTATLANIQAMSLQFRQTSDTARTLVGNIDSDRARVVGDVRGVLKNTEAATASANKTLKVVESDLPQALEKTRELLENAKAASADVKQILRESRNDIPAIVRSGRSAAQDAADITTGLKNTWPLSGGSKPPDAGALPLDSFEGRKP